MDDRKKSENSKGNAEQSKPAKPSTAEDMDFCDYASLDPGPSTSKAKPALRIVDDIGEYIVDEEDDLKYEEDEQADDCNDDFDDDEEADLADNVEDDADGDEPNKVQQEGDSKANTGPAWPLKQKRNLDQHLKYKSAKTVLLRKKLNEAKCVSNEETDDDSATARLLSAAFGPFQQCEPTLLSADVEVTILSMYPACLLDLLIDKNLLREERGKAMDAIHQISQRVRVEVIEGKRKTDFGAGNYIMFANVNARHIIELLNWVFYTGLTCNAERRRTKHLAQSEADSFIQDAYWANGTRVAIHDFFPAGDVEAPTEAAQFVKYILILFFQHSSLCQNQRRGTLKNVLSEVSHFNELELTRMGAAVALDQLIGRDSDSFTSYMDVSAYRKKDQTPQPGQHYSTFLKKNIKKRNAVPQPPPSAFTEFPRTIPAGLSLLDCPLDPKLNTEHLLLYAMHLFKAYFGIPPKMARWYLFRENALDRLRDMRDKPLRLHDVRCSIRVVLQNVPATLEDCVVWGAEQFLLLFQTNAQIAAEHNTDPKRKITPLELDMTDEWTQVFVYRAAQLYAHMWSITDQDSGKPPTMDKLHRVYTARTREPKLICKDNRAPYHPITRYDELGYVSEAIDDPTKWPDQSELGHLCDKLQPLDFVSDDQEMKFFLRSIFVLRTRILGFPRNWNTDVIGAIMHAPYFELAHLFPQYV